MSLPTFSHIARAMKCLGACVLPCESDVKSDAASLGAAKHEHLARLVGGMSETESFALVPEKHRLSLDLNDWASIAYGLKGWTSEQAYVFDASMMRGRYLGANLGREYKVESSEFAGSIDYLRIDGRRAEIRDLKTGHVPVSAQDNWQLKAAAVAVAHTHGLREVSIAITTVKEGCTPTLAVQHLDAFDLGEAAHELQQLHRRIADAQGAYAARCDTPALSMGPHCQGCRSKAYCPAFATATASLVKEPHKALVLPLDTREQRTAAYLAMRETERLLAHLKQQLAATSIVEPIQVEPGTLWGPIERSRESIDAAKALPLLERYVGRSRAMSAVDVSISKAAIKRTLVAYVQTGESQRRPSEIERELLDQLRAAGAIESKTTSTYHEHKGDLPPQPHETTGETK